MSSQRLETAFSFDYNNNNNVTRITNQMNRQHSAELNSQHEYMKRSEKELHKKHAMQQKQQPKSLKVSLISHNMLSRLAPS